VFAKSKAVLMDLFFLVDKSETNICLHIYTAISTAAKMINLQQVKINAPSDPNH